MRKSRVEKNKDLYEDLGKKEEVNEEPNLDSFDLEDLGDLVNNQQKLQSEPIVDLIKEEKKEIKKEEDVQPNVMVVKEDEFKIEQPVSYNEMLKAEEVLRNKLEKQKELKNSRKSLKRTPVTKEYTPEMMQKNISQASGVDIRKELNIKVRRANNSSIFALVLLLIIVLVLAGSLIYLVVGK